MTLHTTNICKALGAILSLAATLSLTPANATEVFQDTNVSIGYTQASKLDPALGTGSSDKKVVTLRFEHYGVWAYGDNYILVDNYSGNNMGNIPGVPPVGSFGDNARNQQLIVYVPRFSLSKTAGLKIGGSIIKDVYLVGRLERASYANFQADNVGISFDWNVPGMALLETDFYYRKAKYTGSTADTGTFFWRTVAVAPIEMAGVKAHFGALLLVNKGRGAGGTDIYFEPELMFPIGVKGLELGYRHIYHKFDGYSRTSPTLVAKWHF
jgi:nucleoside-specific outer membrane channel protein Tsx